MPVDLTEAVERHRRGDLEPAAEAYRAALREDPDRPEALYLLGMVSLQRGDPGPAAELIGRAVALRPGEADYHAGLAEACRLLGRSDRALACCREAARLRPESPEHLGNLGALLVDRGEIDAALVAFREAIRLRPDSAALHNNLGNALGIRGDAASALAHFRAAVGLDPAAVEALGNLGKALLERGEPEEALVHYREAVRLRPGTPAIRVPLGNALLATGRLDEAEACLREAIRLGPGMAAAHASLAGVLEQRGDLDGAIGSIREALRLDPRHDGALARLATRLRAALPEPDRAAIEGLLADPDLPPARRYPLLFGLAQVSDARGEFDRAAQLAAEANALQSVELRSKGRGYDPRSFGSFVDELEAAFTPEFFAKVRGWGLETRRPVFVVGLPRSGTSLVEQILASHPLVFGAGELPLARRSFEAIPEVTGRSGTVRECLDGLGPGSLRGLALRHLDGMAAVDGAADRVVDKMPENTVYLGLIAAMFPGATLIHCRRDARDVALSCWLTNFGQVRWASDPDQIASRIAEYRRLMDHWRRSLPIAILEVDYEAIVSDLEREARAMVAFTGLEWDPACLAFHETPRTVRTASLAQVRRPIHSGSVGRWENYRRPLAGLFAALDRDE